MVRIKRATMVAASTMEGIREIDIFKKNRHARQICSTYKPTTAPESVNDRTLKKRREQDPQSRDIAIIKYRPLVSISSG
jgi:hypothetical protein